MTPNNNGNPRRDERGICDGEQFVCRVCARPLGIIDRKNLVIKTPDNWVVIVSPTDIRCGHCLERNKWFPITNPQNCRKPAKVT